MLASRVIRRVREVPHASESELQAAEEDKHVATAAALPRSASPVCTTQEQRQRRFLYSG